MLDREGVMDQTWKMAYPSVVNTYGPEDKYG